MDSTPSAAPHAEFLLANPEFLRELGAGPEPQRARGAHVPAAAEPLQREHARRALAGALAALDEQQRFALMLRFHEQLPLRALALRLDLSSAAARTQVEAGLASLRAELDRRCGPDRQRWSEALVALPFARAFAPALGERRAARASSNDFWGWVLAALLPVVAVVMVMSWPSWAFWIEPTPVEEPLDENVIDGWRVPDPEPPPAEPSVELPAEHQPILRATRVLVLRSEDAAPLVDARVRAVRAGATLFEGRTDRDGALSLELPFPSELFVVVDATGSSLAHEEVVDTACLDFQSPAWTLHVPGAYSVEGTTVDAAGAAVAFAEVLAFCVERPVIFDGGAREAWATTRSDASGRFALGALPTQFYLHARAPGLATPSGFAARFDGPRSSAGVALVLAPTHELRGQVLDADGFGLAGALVEACPVDARGRALGDASRRWVVATATRSDSDGAFTLRGLPAQAVRVAPTLAGFYGERRELAGDCTRADLLLERGAELELAVHAPDGGLVSGANVQIAGAEVARDRAQTDGDGVCRFGSRGPLGQAVVRIEADGYATAVRALRLAPGGPAYSSTRLEEALSIEGTLVLASGEAAAGVEVIALARLADSGGDSALERAVRSLAAVARTTSDEHGAFRLAGLEAHDYELELVLDGRTRGRRSARGGEHGVALALDPPLEGAVLLRGRAVDALTGRGLERFTVTARGARFDNERAAVYRAPGGDDGRFEFLVGTPGAWSVSLRAEGYAPYFARPQFLPEGPRTLEIALDPQRTLSVRLVDRRGAPVRAARLLCQTARGRPIAIMITPSYWLNSVEVSSRGEARLAGLPARRVYVQVRLPELDLEERWNFDLTRPLEGPQELRLPIDTSSARREIVLDLYEQAAHGRTHGALRGELQVAVYDELGALTVAFGASAERDGLWVVERPTRALMQRYDADGRLEARSLLTLPSDALTRDLGPHSASEQRPSFRMRVPLSRCRIVARCEGFQTQSLELPAAPPDAPPQTLAMQLRREH